MSSSNTEYEAIDVPGVNDVMLGRGAGTSINKYLMQYLTMSRNI